ncbi:zinc finger protein AEBP2 [Pungitius pungitius]|uniref:zinc finger protein AEBP2 n=1 Tax=Pungitius pungitius TaxID=134920 RepID=UPI002E0E9F9C
MAQITSEGTEQDSQSTSDQNGTRETAETGKEGQAAPDPKQEPGDNNEHSAEMDVNGGRGAAAEEDADTLSRFPNDGEERAVASEKNGTRGGVHGGKLSEPEKSPAQGSLSSSTDSPEQREGENVFSSAPADHEKTAEKADHGTKTSAGAELSQSDAEPLSRMDSEDSIGSTLMDMESTASSGRSTPAMLNGHSAVGGSGSAAGGGKSLSYTCCWDHCQLLFPSSPDLAEHIRGTHVDGQRGGVFVCLWKGCKVYNTPSTSQSWLQRHMLTHSGDKPFKCVVGGCNATFASQGGLARHVPTHFSSQSSSKMSNQGKVKEESPSKASLNKRRKLKNKHRRSLPRPHDFFDAQTMDAIRHRAICLNLATHIESLGNGHSVVFHSTVIARRKEDSGKVKVLLHWSPEDILPDVWVNESDRLQQKTQVVHLSKLPTDTAVLLDPNIYRMFF